MASIQGNTQSQQQKASLARTENKKAGYRIGTNAAISAVLVLITITLTLSNVGFWWGLIAVGSLFVAAKVAGGIPIISPWWPKAFKSFGWITLAVLILSNGLGQWIGSAVNSMDLAASCSADPTTPACVEKAKMEQAKRSAKLAMIQQQRQSYRAPAPSLLGEEAYEVNLFGKFKPVKLAAGDSVGPLNHYQGSCFYAIKTGVGELQVFSRPDFTSNPVPAVMGKDGVTVDKWGHEGSAYQVFYKGKSKKLTLELERRAGDNSCK